MTKPIKHPIDERCFVWEIHIEDQATLDEMQKSIDDLVENATYYRHVIAEREKTIDLKQETIDKLKDVMLKDGVIKCLESKIALKDKALVAAREIVEKSYRQAVQYKEQNEALKADTKRIAANYQGHNAHLKDKIEDLSSQLTEKRAIINEITRRRVNEVETRQALEAELSVRKQDSEVLLKVAGVVRDWLDTPLSDRSALNRLEYVTKDYLNIPEGFSLDVPEPPIEEEHFIIVDVNSVEDVTPIVEKIAKSVAALTGNHVKARVQFVTQDDEANHGERA